MKQRILLSVSCLALLLICTSAKEKSRMPIDYCQVYGVIYLETDRAYADVRVYVEETEGSARMHVFKEDNSLYADKPGVWYITNNRQAADFRVYVEKNKSFANFSIFYTDNPSFAGCR